jgi:hypothetical protein
MSNKNLSAEQIDTNYKKIVEFVEKLGERSELVKSMLDVLGERFALCPASSRLDQHSCFPGGLIEHSLNVLVNALKIRKVFEYDISLESIIITALFHDLGKIGNLEESYYVEQDSQWHRDKLGELYKYNKNIQFMTVPHRSIFLLQHFGVKLSQDEMIAILIHDGQHIDDNKSYKNREPQLADLIHQADFIASKQEKRQ